MQDVIDLLTQGSVWKKNAGKKAGQQAKVLFLTNVTLPATVRKVHPIQVVYADAENNVYSRVVEDFAAQYTFFNVDADLETKLESILVFNEDDYDDAEPEADDEDADEEVDAETPTTSSSFADSLLEDELEHAAIDHPDADYAQTVVQFVMTSNAEAPSILSDAELGEAMVAYSQEPLLGRNMIQHKMLFALSDSVTVDTLKATWLPSELRNTVDSFAVVGPHFNEVVAWTDYLGVYPEVAQGRAFATVLVGEEIEVRVREDAVEVADEVVDNHALTNAEVHLAVYDEANIPQAPAPASNVTEVFIPQVQVVQESQAQAHQAAEPQTQIVTENTPTSHPVTIPSVQQSVQNLVQNLTPGQQTHHHTPHNPQQ